MSTNDRVLMIFLTILIIISNLSLHKKTREKNHIRNYEIIRDYLKPMDNKLYRIHLRTVPVTDMLPAKRVDHFDDLTKDKYEKDRLHR